MISKKSPRNLLIICYPHGWHWGLSVEFLFNEISKGNLYDVVDASFIGDNKLKVRIKKFLGGYKFRSSSIKMLALGEINVINLNKLKSNKLQKKSYKREVKITHSPIITSPAYNSIAEKTGLLELSQIRRSFRARLIMNKEISDSNLLYKKLITLNHFNYTKVVTVNGRFTKNSTVIYWCKKNGVKTSLLEFGSLNKNAFELYENSPHDPKEIEEKIKYYWDNADESYRENVAKIYLANIVQNRSSSKINFRKKTVLGKKPALNVKKVCVYYANSEYEYAGLNLSIDPGHFRNQVEALRGLLTALNNNEWDIYLRRHPKDPSAKVEDTERFLWTEFNTHDNIHIISPDSDIDSLALGESADLIASFGSTINIEFVARELQNVVTLGPAPWNQLLPSRYLPSIQEINRYLSNDPEKISSKNIWPWAYYMAESGIDFKFIETNKVTGEWSFKKS